MGLKATNTGHFFILDALLESTAGGILKRGKDSHFIYPAGKPGIPHLLRCRGFAVKYYSFTLDA
jgi:hypothetical protein